MTNETLTQDFFNKTKSIPKSALSQHEQFALGVYTLAKNGASMEELIPLLEKNCDQAEMLACKITL
jgi:hypothetical protein